MRLAALSLTDPGDYNRAVSSKATTPGQTGRDVAGYTQTANTSAISVSGGSGSGSDAFRAKRSATSQISHIFRSRDAGLLITQNGDGIVRLGSESCHNGC